MLISEIIFCIILLAVCIGAIKLILSVGSTIAKVILHIIAGWVLLSIVNILPGINVPINLITVLISGFGGVMGTFLLVILYLIF